MLLGVIQGLSNRQMSETYGLAERTVKHYRTLLTRRLDVYTSVDLCRLVQEAGLTAEDIAAAIDATPATALQ
jgi:DNA-binding NarL/FixJ family response regulator